MSILKRTLGVLCGMLIVAAAHISPALGAKAAKPAKVERPPSLSQSDRQAIIVLGADKNILEASARSERAVLNRDMVSAGCQWLYNVVELATPTGIAAIKARLDKCRDLNQSVAKLLRNQWLAWQERTQQSTVPASVSAELRKSFSKAFPRFESKQALVAEAAEAHSMGVLKAISFGERFAGKLKAPGSTLILPGGPPSAEFSKLKAEIEDLQMIQLRAERVLEGQSDASVHVLQCMLDGHTASSTPGLPSCVLKARVVRAREQLLKDLVRIEGAPLLNDIAGGALQDKLLSADGLEEVRRLNNEIRTRSITAILAIESSFAEFEGALSDLEESTETEEIKAGGAIIGASRTAIDARFAASIELTRAMDQMITFFSSNLGRIRKQGQGLLFPSRPLHDEFTKVIARFNEAEAKLRALDDDSSEKLEKLKDLTFA